MSNSDLSSCSDSAGGSASDSSSSLGLSPEEQPSQRNPGWHFTVVTASFTLGTVYSPYTLGAAGWTLGSAFWLYSVSVTWWSGILIGKCVLDGKRRGVPSTYPDMMRDAFGFPGFCFAAFMQIATYYMLCVALLVNIANWLLLSQAILEPEDPLRRDASLQLCLWQWILAAGALATLLAQIKTFRNVLPLALVSLVSTLARQGIMYYQIGSQDLLQRCSPKFGGVTVQSAFNSLATTGFLFGGHGLFPEEIRELRRPESYFRALHWAYAIMTVVYLTNAYVAYAVWGDWVAGDVQFNWPLNSATLVSAVLSSVWALIEMTMSHVMMLSHIEHFLGVWWRRKVAEEDSEQQRSAAAPCLLRFALRTLVVWSEVFFAVMLSGAGIANLQALVGALGFAALTYYAPFAVYWKLLARRELRRRGRWRLELRGGCDSSLGPSSRGRWRESVRLQLAYFVVGLSGTVLMVFGVYSSVLGIAEQMHMYSLFDTSKCSSSDITNVTSCSNPCHAAYGAKETCAAVA